METRTGKHIESQDAGRLQQQEEDSVSYLEGSSDDCTEHEHLDIYYKLWPVNDYPADDVGRSESEVTANLYYATMLLDSMMLSLKSLLTTTVSRLEFMFIENNISVMARMMPYLRVQSFETWKQAMDLGTETPTRDASDEPDSDASDEPTLPLVAQGRMVTLSIINLVGDGFLRGNIVWKENDMAGNYYGVTTALETCLVFSRWLVEKGHQGILPSCKTIHSFIQGMEYQWCLPAHYASVPLDYRRGWKCQHPKN
ncbi:hypothetical protein GQ602_006837 [Ophiocordyceps camponoti-floridani]|uniref:Uncharacterized protein n=1 Tax=Ophiocordyceps camponoti-floridani TaxID=2030778 RepID=A0A8H4Q225_9HYPO|nr:hypothetical protein GQ602_006837 [Ophiocordyceps camponoti-floridani]